MSQKLQPSIMKTFQNNIPDYYDSFWGKILLPCIPSTDGEPDYTQYGLSDTILKEYFHKMYDLMCKWYIGEDGDIEDFIFKGCLYAFLPIGLIFEAIIKNVILAVVVTVILELISYFVVTKIYNKKKHKEFELAKSPIIEKYLNDLEKWRKENGQSLTY